MLGHENAWTLDSGSARSEDERQGRTSRRTPMKTRTRFLLILAAIAALGATLTTFRPWAQEVEEEEPPSVSEKDLSMYIDVYKAMQSDHDLTIENAIQPFHIQLEEFRQIERKIQNQPRLVDRVREALLEHVKAHSAFAQALATATPAATPTPKKHGKKNKD